MAEFCRACLDPCEIETSVTSANFITQYHKLTGFVINPETDGPKRICFTCLDILEQALAFKERSEEVEKILEANFVDLKPEVVILLEPKEEPVSSDDDFLSPTAKPRPKVKPEPKDEPVGSEDDFFSQVLTPPAKPRPKKHKKVKTKEKRILICEFCSNTFSDPKSLLGHIRRIHQELKVPCDLCDMVFNSRRNLKNHRLNKHVSPSEWPYHCEKCGSSFYRKERFIHHQMRHDHPRPFVCKLCSRRFSDPRQLYVHKKNLHNETIFSCKVCGKNFKGADYLTQHSKTHTLGEYKCPLCPDKDFAFPTTLRSHLKSNHPNLPIPPPGTKLKNYDWAEVMKTK